MKTSYNGAASDFCCTAAIGSSAVHLHTIYGESPHSSVIQQQQSSQAQLQIAERMDIRSS